MDRFDEDNRYFHHPLERAVSADGLKCMTNSKPGRAAQLIEACAAQGLKIVQGDPVAPCMRGDVSLWVSPNINDIRHFWYIAINLPFREEDYK